MNQENKIKEKVLGVIKKYQRKILQTKKRCIIHKTKDYPDCEDNTKNKMTDFVGEKVRVAFMLTELNKELEPILEETSKQIFDDIDELMEDGILPTSPSYEELKKKWCK